MLDSVDRIMLVLVVCVKQVKPVAVTLVFSNRTSGGGRFHALPRTGVVIKWRGVGRGVESAQWAMCRGRGAVEGRFTILKLKDFKQDITLALRDVKYSIVIMSGSRRAVRRVTSEIACTVATSVARGRTLDTLKAEGLSKTVVKITRGLRTKVVTALLYGRVKVPVIITGTGGGLRKAVLGGIKTSAIMCPRVRVNDEITGDLLTARFAS